jgi:NADP-dependent aldehyde dehydrogenase
VAGGDTASALAAGCPVVFKGHPAHPGTCEMIATAIINAVKKTEMPEGTFSLVQGPSVEVGMKIVNHPLIKAIGFTGSYRGGKAIFDAANARPEPIPVYAEMGSTNPVFILPGILAERKAAIASGLSASVTLGVGQFCTNPGLIISEKSKESAEFIAAVADGIKNSAASSMLTAGIHNAYNQGVKKLSDSEGVEVIAKGGESDEGFKGTPYMMQLDANKFMSNKALEEEVFGPSTLAVNADDKEDILTIAENLGGHLTATIFATEEELSNYTDLIAILERKVGRLIINAFPTGVEVCHAMIHGGPFPATSNSMTTSVGTSAIRRFSRPVCYQNLQDDLLPDELRNSNPLGIMRLFDGELKR